MEGIVSEVLSAPTALSSSASTSQVLDQGRVYAVSRFESRSDRRDVLSRPVSSPARPSLPGSCPPTLKGCLPAPALRNARPVLTVVPVERTCWHEHHLHARSLCRHVRTRRSYLASYATRLIGVSHFSGSAGGFRLIPPSVAEVREQRGWLSPALLLCVEYHVVQFAHHRPGDLVSGLLVPEEVQGDW